ncbi:hypothetical protein [Flavobacterium cerinum]|uniref:Uncharacterized protein n=1 Tax=Flavobacterium cerinum TaxID=2502784 RepID=A0ABY5ITF8_9FLAO|nr:hypothetical protein [Flavobacterium cerinum]UUC44751.1 hypothetical protein NOX80_14070 [Flavobacterium cerinum]
MTDKELQEILKEKIEQDDCFNKDIQKILLDFKDSGGEQETAKKLVEQLAIDFSNDETLRDNAYDILDIVTGWCSPDMRVWDKLITESITDGLRIEDDETGVLFNQYSFCEFVKHIMVNYGKIDYDLATEKLNNSYLIKVPRTISDVEFITHELEFHWAMLLVHGDMYWTKGIPCNFNNFKEEYFTWATEVKQKYNLKEPYTYYDK